MTSSVSFFAMMVGCGFPALTCPEIVKHSARNFNCRGVISQRHSLPVSEFCLIRIDHHEKITWHASSVCAQPDRKKGPSRDRPAGAPQRGSCAEKNALTTQLCYVPGSMQSGSAAWRHSGRFIGLLQRGLPGRKKAPTADQSAEAQVWLSCTLNAARGGAQGAEFGRFSAAGKGATLQRPGCVSAPTVGGVAAAGGSFRNR